MICAPFPYFGGKRTIAATVWSRLGTPTQYIEPFCGSAAVLLAAPRPASLEVIGDANGFIANFWRAVKHDAEAVATWSDYPVSHVDLGGRHQWLMAQRERVAAELLDPEWPGDAKVAGWWLWGQCAWIGSGWCDWNGKAPNGNGKIPALSTLGNGVHAAGQVPYVSGAGMGIQAAGRVPQYADTGRGVLAAGRIPHAGNAGRGVQAPGKIRRAPEQLTLWTSAGATAWWWLQQIAVRLERVRVVHGHWDRCLNAHYGGGETAYFLDPPYHGHGGVYGETGQTVQQEIQSWALANGSAYRIALCGLVGEYDLPGWEVVEWSRGKLTYNGGATTELETVWFSPKCLREQQASLFD